MSRRALAAAAVAIALLAGGSALGYVRATVQGNASCPLWWGKRSVPYVVNDFSAQAARQVCGTTPAEEVATADPAVQASFATWTQATRTGASSPCTDLKLVHQGTTASIATGADSQNLVVFRRGQCTDPSIAPSSDPCHSDSSCADKYNCWDHGSSGSGANVIALTTTSYVKSTGEIVDADMELNGWDGVSGSSPGFYFTCVGATSTDRTSPPPDCPGAPAPDCACTSKGQSACIDIDVQNTVTHESGHFIGLAHPPANDPNYATMDATAASGETSKRTLTQDDVNGVCTIYPAGGPTAACAQGGGCGCRSAGPEGAIALLGLLALARRRRPAAGTERGVGG